MVYKGMVYKGQNISSIEDFRKKLGYSVDPSTERFWHKGQYVNTQQSTFDALFQLSNPDCKNATHKSSCLKQG